MSSAGQVSPSSPLSRFASSTVRRHPRVYVWQPSLRAGDFRYADEQLSVADRIPDDQRAQLPKLGPRFGRGGIICVGGKRRNSCAAGPAAASPRFHKGPPGRRGHRGPRPQRRRPGVFASSRPRHGAVPGASVEPQTHLDEVAAEHASECPLAPAPLRRNRDETRKARERGPFRRSG